MREPITIPLQCPCCAAKLSLINEQIFCTNTSCPAQLSKKMEHFVKVLAIKGLGPKSLDKLGLTDLLDIFYLDEGEIADALGKTIAAKIIKEIESAKNNASLATVIESFGIPLVGGTASTKIASIVSSIDAITAEACKEAGLGDKVTSNLLNWVATEYQEIKEFLPFKFPSKQVTIADGLTVCITGKISSYKTKADAGVALAAAGYRLVDSVTKSLNYLVDEEDKSSTKRAKAESYGIPIITDLKSLLERNT